MNTNESKPKQTQFDFNNVNSCLSNQNSIEFNCKDNYLYRTSLIAVSSQYQVDSKNKKCNQNEDGFKEYPNHQNIILDSIQPLSYDLTK